MTLAQMQGAALANLPCGSTSDEQRGRPGHRDSIATTVTYYNAAGAVLACPLAAGAAVTQALVKSTATTNPLAGQTPAKRTIESLVQVIPSPALNKAIFGNAGVETNKHLDVNGSQPGRNDANVYSNHHVTCSGDGQYNGSLIVQGTITLGQLQRGRQRLGHRRRDREQHLDRRCPGLGRQRGPERLDRGHQHGAGQRHHQGHRRRHLGRLLGSGQVRGRLDRRAAAGRAVPAACRTTRQALDRRWLQPDRRGEEHLLRRIRGRRRRLAPGQRRDASPSRRSCTRPAPAGSTSRTTGTSPSTTTWWSSPTVV